MVSRAIKIFSFQNFYEVLKTYSAGRKDFFDTLRYGFCSDQQFLPVRVFQMMGVRQGPQRFSGV